MKANAPKKIYISPLPNHSDGYVGVAWDEPHKNMVEYVRMDSFIEKACARLEQILEPYVPYCNINTDLVIEKFKIHMEG